MWTGSSALSGFMACGHAQDLFPAEPKIEAFLTDLAVRGNVAPATQNQAMNALVFLYKRVLAKRRRAVSMPCVLAGRSLSLWS